MANDDRVGGFVRWARNHATLSVLIIAGLAISAVSTAVQSGKFLYETVASIFKMNPPPVTVDLTYRISRDLATLGVDTTIVNGTERPIYLKCAGLHLDEGIVENVWLTAESSSTGAIQPASQTIFHGTVSLKSRDDQKEPLREVWFSVESNSQTIFQSTSLLEEFKKVQQFVRNYRPSQSGVVDIVPSRTIRLKPSSKPMTISTFGACDPG